MKTLIFLLGLSSAAAAQVTGTVEYQDRAYDQSGFFAVVTRAVRQAEIDVVRASDDLLYGTGVTDNTGAFSVSGVPAGQVVRLRVYAHRAGGQVHVAVRNNPNANLLYAVAGPTIDTGVTTSFGTVTLTIAGGSAPIFNIFDCAVKSFEYLSSLDGSIPAVPPLLIVYWEPGSPNGTYFDRVTNAISLLGGSSDPDQYDDDIIFHEIGHWVAFNFSKDDTLGGAHTIVDQLDPRTSWSEGWAHYWSSAVRRHHNLTTVEYTAPNLQVDTFGISASVFDLEAPSFPAQAIMATNELAVGSILWHILEAASGSSGDTIADREGEIWRSLTVRIPARTDITLEDFHAGLGAEAPAIMPGVTGSETTSGIFKDRSVRYYPDGSEPNDAAAGAPPLPLGVAGLTLRTIYNAGDQDWYTVDATPGTLVVETLNLGDGADTLLQLWDAAGTVLLNSNDNRSPGNRSSLLAQVVFAPTTFRVRVLASGVIVQHGYYDLRAQIVVNGPTVITSIGASSTSGPAPLRVTFSASISDVDGGAHEFQWDFNGDGLFDWSSTLGPGVTTTYDEPGTYVALLRVNDSGDSIATASITITVTPSSVPTISFFASPSIGAAPLPVTFSATVSGAVPVAYLWDFEGDGTTDAASVTSPGATFVYRAGGTYFPRLIVRDSLGRATRAVGPSITVGAGASPPTIGSFLAGSGFLPYASTFTVAHSDLGPTGFVEIDIDGDGRVDAIVPPGSATDTTFVSEIQRAGPLFPRVRVTDSAGRSLSTSTSFSARILGVSGWMISPRAGDRLAGTSVTLTARAVPEGVTKVVQFQRRDSLGGPWTNIGAPQSSQGTLFAASWDVSTLPDLSSMDVRILVNGTVSSGDTANTVVIDAAAPTIAESGSVRTVGVRTDRTVVSRNARGVWVTVPPGAPSAPLPLRLEPATAPAAGGSALGMIPQGGAWRIGMAGTFRNTIDLRLPIEGPASPDLEIHHVDEASGVWQRLAFPRVSPADGWVEASVNAPGVYAVFAPAERRGGGGGCGALGVEGLAIAALGLVRRRRR